MSTARGQEEKRES